MTGIIMVHVMPAQYFLTHTFRGDDDDDGSSFGRKVVEGREEKKVPTSYMQFVQK